MQNKTQDAGAVVAQLLEPVLLGLLTGKKKLVIDSRASLELVGIADEFAPASLIHYRHTFKVVDCAEG